MNEYLPTSPFDIYELYLFHLVAKHSSFTRAGEFAGLSQSAITRQIQGMELRLGVSLLERTTRSVRPTDAGYFLLQESSKILSSVEGSILTLREQFANAPKQVRVGVSRTIGLAYLPGFFFASRKKLPNVMPKVFHQSSGEILGALEMGDVDVGVLCPPKRLPKGLKVTHKFQDEFTLITPRGLAVPAALVERWSPEWLEWSEVQNWLLIHDESNTGQFLRQWLAGQKLRIEPDMQSDNFDLIINLVSLGMGVSLVPHRALALYSGKRSIQRIRLKNRFSRELVVVIRGQQQPADHIVKFVDNILF